MFTKEVKDRWLAALRSGEFEQGRNALRTRTDQFCCLGVLNKTCGKGVWELPYGDRKYTYTTPKGRNFFGIINNDEFPEVNDASDTLITMNDSGETFAAIATWIEANIPATDEATDAS